METTVYKIEYDINPITVIVSIWFCHLSYNNGRNYCDFLCIIYLFIYGLFNFEIRIEVVKMAQTISKYKRRIPL
jgi:hypothetical protein